MSAKIEEKKVIQICKLIDSGCTDSLISESIDVSIASVNRCRRILEWIANDDKAQIYTYYENNSKHLPAIICGYKGYVLPTSAQAEKGEPEQMAINFAKETPAESSNVTVNLNTEELTKKMNDLGEGMLMLCAEMSTLVKKPTPTTDDLCKEVRILSGSVGNLIDTIKSHTNMENAMLRELITEMQKMNGGRRNG